MAPGESFVAVPTPRGACTVGLPVAVSGGAGGTCLFGAGTPDDAEDDAVASACPETEDVADPLRKKRADSNKERVERNDSDFVSQ